ncbi:DEAD/DEAH box helicase [Jatrophihabitans telluris]|uniref:DEAD/DEAH box helicase n=1 Tax=Jatrophihabitans telluris TaxID=2038343 RepID=A0ABY4QUL0_9ACTN|nr:DEAD/DEAH box helicase [Jatrophihabitans telluris]UQX86664.1 DEAD/DEAH box helicase [Jatrophihabitans telluris]
MSAPGLGPAERYAQARRRRQYPTLADFRSSYPFELDPFQVEAAEGLEDGYGVLVCAPTGAGKTVVGEFAIHLALQLGQKCFYTTPIKALSNQKYNDLIRRYGSDKVGLLTGDNAVNSGAPIVVMTTEVLRNMLYVGSPALTGLGYVVMDEVHYLGDRFRGAVWEEVIIHLPASVRLVSLSATVSNAEEFGDWLVEVRGDTRVIVHEQRPVPLWQHMIVGTRLFDLFSSEQVERGTQNITVDPQLRSYIRERARFEAPDRRRGANSRDRHRPPHGPRWHPPHRADVLARLDRDGLLPAITFIFSRAGCDAAVRQCVLAGVRLTTDEEREQIRGLVEERTANLAPDDLDVLGYWEWLEGLQRGVAAHHAGLIPAFKETVEELFVRGLVRMVFATETLALGINMPARTVLLERLVKFNGEGHVELTPGEYTQLTGRAGRRGIDIEGHAVVQWGPEIDPDQVAGLASTRTFPLRSSFRPSYNMAINLVAQVGRDTARELLESSFAQFQADRSVVGITRQVVKNQRSLDEYRSKMACHLGDFSEYAAIRQRIGERESELARAGASQRRAAVVQSLEALRIGDVIRIPTGKRAGLAVVLDPGASALADARPMVLTLDRWAGRISSADFSIAAEVLGQVRVPKHFNARNPGERRDLASSLRNLRLPDGEPRGRRRSRSAAADDQVLTDLRAELRAHPCHGCHDREEHARWAERYHRLKRESDALQHKAERRTHSLSRTFDAICALLTVRGYMHPHVMTEVPAPGEPVAEKITADGRLLSRIWSEADLLIAECLRTGAWDGLNAAELAAVCSSVVYEARREETSAPKLPQGASRAALAETARLWGELTERESEYGLPITREPDLGFVWASYRWARGDSLDKVLTAWSEDGTTVPAGDFVRWVRQLLDLLEQLARSEAVPAAIRTTAGASIAALRRGVIAQQL